MAKKSEKTKVKDELDRVFSLFIRARDKKCVQCGKTYNLTNGHLISRRKLETRWCEMNCNCQCTGCNLSHEYNREPYTIWFIDKYGSDEYKKLYEKSRNLKGNKYGIKIMREMIKEYKKKLKDIEEPQTNYTIDDVVL